MTTFGLSRNNIGAPKNLGPKVDGMAGTLLNLVLLGFLLLIGFVCVAAPLAALGFMFWQWHKELAETSRLRQVRSTQVR